MDTLQFIVSKLKVMLDKKKFDKELFEANIALQK